jgi:MYXO-CTERM domain-containing protein
MKNMVFAGVMAGVAALACVAPASASVYDLTFTGTGISGELVLSLANGTSPFKVSGASGTLDLGGTVYSISGLATYAGDDQTAYFPTSSSVSFVDFPGISAATTGGFALNLFAFSPTSYGVLLSDENASGNPYSGHYYSVTVTDTPPGASSTAPEASTWAMMLVGFAGLGFVATRRRRTPIAAVADRR